MNPAWAEPPASILAVDDNRDGLRLLARLLSDQGFRVRPVIDGASALATAEAEPPDLVLLDVHMPGIDGYEVCRRLKASERTAGVPVIFLSAADEAINKVQAFAVGGADFVTKPYKTEEVLARIDAQLRLYRLQARIEAQNRALQAENAERQRAEAALLELNQRLEELIAERTADLSRANAELKVEIAERLSAEAALRESEQKYRSIVWNAPVGIFRSTPEGRFLEVNSVMATLFGYESPEAMEGEIHDFAADLLVHSEEHRLIVGELLRTGGVTQHTNRYRRRDGSEFIANLYLATLQDEAGAPQFLEGIVEDIAERKRTEETLRESEAKFRRLIEASPMAMAIADEEGHIEYFNARFFERFGYRRDDIPRVEDWFERAYPNPSYRQDVMARWNAGMEIAKLNGTDFAVNDVKIVCRDGSVCAADVMGALIGDKALAIFNDITERKRAEAELLAYRDHLEDLVGQRTAELAQAKDAAEAASRAKSMFLANMSHELRTPLNAILGFAALLRRDAAATDFQQKSLDIINRSGAHLLSLINDILDMVKIDSGRVQVRLASFDLNGLIGGVADSFRGRAAAKGVGLRVERASPVPRYIRSDEAKLRQALVNLADNAFKFTDAGEVVLRVEMLSGSTTPWLSFEVQDSGIGISADDRRRIFDPFVQVSGLDAQEGTGLGLSITRRFAELLGGRIEVTSQLGRGSCFRLELPVEEVEEVEAPQAGDEAREVIGLEPGQPDHRILIVDDQPENALLLKRLLETVGFPVQIANNGVRGVELFADWRPDFIWMDWRMPVLDGVEATRRIRAAEGGSAVKIAAITASVLPEQQEAILAVGVDDIVRKPYAFRTIFDCLARHLGVRYVYRERAAAPDPAEGRALAPAALSELPEDVRRELADALVALDCARIDELIGRVAERDAELARALRRHADAFDYDPIMKALAPAGTTNEAA
jgi:PAS domain S-box-containing protein